MRGHAYLILLAACGSGGGFPDAPAGEPRIPGTFAISWSLADANGQAMTCEQAGATTVHVGIVDAATGAQFSQSFACGLGEAVSGQLFPASYDLTFTLANDTGTLATGTAQSGLAIQANKTTTVPAETFTIASAADVLAVVDANQPALDALAARVAHLKTHFPDAPGWENALRTAQLANDRLGLWPFEQSELPGPGWRPSPATLLGYGPYVRQRAPELARTGKLVELQALALDLRRRYAEGLAQADADLATVERWVAVNRRRAATPRR